MRYVQPLNERHLNRLLSEFRIYYNTARPHMANGEKPAILPDVTIASDIGTDSRGLVMTGIPLLPNF